jgi:RNA polymerase sigma-70 factor (ECF subfamily)
MRTMKDTTLGGLANGFPPTTWSVIVSCQDTDAADRRNGLNRLCSIYWRPVYAFIRSARRADVEESKDLTQSFFTMLLESDSLLSCHPSHGRFRHFLKAVLRKFLAMDLRDRGRLKRGGGVRIEAFDEEAHEIEASADADTAFDREWSLDVIGQAMTRLEAALAREGRRIYLDAYAAYTAPASNGVAPTYESVASSLGITVTQLTNYLHAFRRRLHQAIRDVVSDSVATRQDLTAEMAELFKT